MFVVVRCLEQKILKSENLVGNSALLNINKFICNHDPYQSCFSSEFYVVFFYFLFLSSGKGLDWKCMNFNFLPLKRAWRVGLWYIKLSITMLKDPGSSPWFASSREKFHKQ